MTDVHYCQKHGHDWQMWNVAGRVTRIRCARCGRIQELITEEREEGGE